MLTLDGKAGWGVEPGRLTAALPLLAKAVDTHPRAASGETTFGPGGHKVPDATINNRNRIAAGKEGG